MSFKAVNVNAPGVRSLPSQLDPVAGVVSTSAYVAVAGSQLDLAGTQHAVPWFQVTETGGSNGVTVKIQMSADGTTWFDVSSTSISPTGTSTAGVDQAVTAGSSLIMSVATCARFVQLLIKDTSGGSHGTATVKGFGR